VARLSADQLRALTAEVGLAGEAQRIAVAIALAESGGNTDAVGDGGKSIGLWQIHTGFNPQFDRGMLRTPEYNARAMMALSGGGRNWQPWSVYKNGSYRQYMNQAGSLTPALAPEGSPQAGLLDAGAGAAGAVAGVIASPLKAVGNLVGILTDPSWWKRLGVGLGGFLLLAVAGFLLLRELALPSVGKLTKGAT
jgi:hypothetical protein